jgi:hypothetical protein
LQGRECSEVFSLQQNSLVTIKSPTQTEASHSRNGIYGMSGRWFYSGLMLAARINLPHFSISSAMRILKSAGEPGSHAAEVGELSLQLGIGEASIDFLVELIDDLTRRFRGSADSEKTA